MQQLYPDYDEMEHLMKNYRIKQVYLYEPPKKTSSLLYAAYYDDSENEKLLNPNGERKLVYVKDKNEWRNPNLVPDLKADSKSLINEDEDEEMQEDDTDPEAEDKLAAFIDDMYQASIGLSQKSDLSMTVKKPINTLLTDSSSEDIIIRTKQVRKFEEEDVIEEEEDYVEPS